MASLSTECSEWDVEKREQPRLWMKQIKIIADKSIFSNIEHIFSPVQWHAVWADPCPAQHLPPLGWQDDTPTPERLCIRTFFITRGQNKSVSHLLISWSALSTSAGKAETSTKIIFIIVVIVITIVVCKMIIIKHPTPPVRFLFPLSLCGKPGDKVINRENIETV